MSCPICTNPDDKTNQIFSTDHWVVLLAPDQGYLGRSYVTLRTHKASLSELSAEEWADFARIVKKLETALAKAYEAGPFNWASMMNNAYLSTPPDPHVHWHFRPRYQQAVTVNNVTFEDPLYGHHYDRDQRNLVDPETLGAILDTIREHISKQEH